MVTLDVLVFYEILVFSLVPLFGVFDLNSVQSANPHEFIALLLLSFI